jgi:hypothetical protein
VLITLQLPGEPTSRSVVQALPSLGQVDGQLPSQISLPSTTPFPHIAEHWLSFVASQPEGQQASPFRHVEIGAKLHCAVH